MIRKIRELLKKEWVKFLLVGGLNTLFGYSVFAFFIFIGFHYALASLCGTILGVIFNFKTIGILVFKNKNNGLIIKFLMIYLLLLGVNILGLKILNSLLYNSYYSGAILVLPLAFLGFFLNKKFVFKSNMK